MKFKIGFMTQKALLQDCIKYIVLFFLYKTYASYCLATYILYFI